MKREVWFAAVVGACLLGIPQVQVSAHDATGVYGAWDLTLETRGGERPSWVKLFKDQDVIVAEFVGTGGGKNRAKDVKVEDEAFEWTMGEATYHATLADGKLTGHLVRGDRRTPFTGERVLRPTNLTGTWDVVIDIGDRSMERTLKLEQKDDAITGLYGGGQLSERKLNEVILDHGRLTYSIDIEIGGQQLKINYDVKLQGDRFAGTVAVEGTDREGKIKATRRREWGEPIELFAGNDLSNWDFQRVGGENQWKVVDGVMANAAAGWNILTKQKFKDYKLRIDVKVPPHGNSGIYLNGRYEIQVADSHGRGVNKGGMGAIYGRAVPTANPSKPADEWQTFEITFVDYWVTVVLNGTTIVDNVLIEGITGGALDSHESETGPIMLQGDHGHIEFRNVVLTPLAR
jgi:hypothetical protein